MTIEALSSKRGRRGKDSVSDALPIGETDSNIFNCPACARPLGSGTARCPGCGTRLIAGVQAGRAVGFLAIGLVVGLVVGGSLMAVTATLTRVSPAVAAGGTTTLPSAQPIASAAPLVTPPPAAGSVIPTAAQSALRQTALVNQRIATGAGLLTAALAAETPSTSDIARALRSMSSNALFAQGIAADIAAWEAGTVVAADLGSFYGAIHSTASEGLGASLNNESAYIAAARSMLAVVDGLGVLDGAARDLASTIDLELPAVDLSAAAGPGAGSSSAPVTP
jgi:hypothetical protein